MPRSEDVAKGLSHLMSPVVSSTSLLSLSKTSIPVAFRLELLVYFGELLNSSSVARIGLED
jgi:hypothetical protein